MSEYRRPQFRAVLHHRHNGYTQVPKGFSPQSMAAAYSIATGLELFQACNESHEVMKNHVSPAVTTFIFILILEVFAFETLLSTRS